MKKSNEPVHRSAAVGFQAAADAYERGRPEYPPEVVPFLEKILNLKAGSTVLDLGAGTGKFTKLLAVRNYRVVAVEPVEAMRTKLQKLLPIVEVQAGTAENIDLPDASVDAIFCAQAFHWFATSHALKEIARVLKPKAGFALLWNVRDESTEWGQALSELVAKYEGNTPRYFSGEWRAPFKDTDFFNALTHAGFSHVQTGDRQKLLDRVLSISFIASLPAEKQKAIVLEVQKMMPSESFELAYRTDVFWTFKND